MKNFSVWSRSRLFNPGAGADPSRLEPEPESAPGPWQTGAGAAQKSGGSATLLKSSSNTNIFLKLNKIIFFKKIAFL